MGRSSDRKSGDKETQDTIDAFLYKMQALSSLAATQLKHARVNQRRELKTISGKLEKVAARFDKGKPSLLEAAHNINTFFDCMKELEPLKLIHHETMLAEILFASIFSSFDAYLNHLLRNLYRQRPNLLTAPEAKDDTKETRETKSVSFADVLHRTKDEIIDNLIDGELNSLLRDSYIRIFERLARRFSTGTLKAFEAWPVFVECSQRRNVIMHCDGIVSKQYVENCKSEGVNIAQAIIVGQTKLSVSIDYLVKSIEVATEVGVKLGQVLWRASSELSVASADVHLGELLYSLLKREEWTLAMRMGEFGREISKRSHRVPRNERSLKVIVINHAQAAKWSGDKTTALKLIEEFDWSGSAFEFQLAV